MFTTTNTVRMYDTDTAQILFFGSQFRFINDALEELLATIGLNMNYLFTECDYGFVVRHAESDYLGPLHVGDKIRIELVVTHIGTTSFEFAYSIFKEATNTLVGTSKSVHVVIDRKTHKKREIPDTLKASLTKYLA
jgi:YbgC/YbaW family acyl-CoA thioester hydrolase